MVIRPNMIIIGGIPIAGPEPAILDWYGHCGVKKLGGSGGMLPQENFKIRHSEIASEAMFGPKRY